MFIRRSLRFLVGLCFVLIILPFNPTAATDIEEHEQSRELTTTTTTPPWATGSYCTPGGSFYDPGAVATCRDCCKERKCRNRCLNQCKSDASSKAQSRKEYCRSYRGYQKDGPPDWPTCSNKLGEYKESHCSDYDRCVTKFEARHIADDAWYYCDALHVPSCSAFGDCVETYEKSLCPGGSANCTQAQEDAAEKEGRDAKNECKPGQYADNTCDHEIPDFDPGCGRCPSQPWKKHERDDWCDACEAKDCDDILKDLLFAKGHSKSGSKGRRAVCDDFWYCIEGYERDYYDSESRKKGNRARRDCNRCENNGGACKDEVGDDHEKGKDDVCLSYLGGWDRSCNSYYDCWNNDLRSECNDCANNGFGCNFKYEQCEDLCLDSEIDCDDECDVCFCESDPDRGIEECQAIGDDCCKDPYGWLDLPDMRSLEYIRECTSSDDCGTCRGNCESDDDCHNVNVCSKGESKPRNIYDIPGCKGDPAKVRVPGGVEPLEVGYCYNPNQINKSYPDHTTVTNQCLAEITTNGYGKCCGLPSDASQCENPTFNKYCARKEDVVIIQPGEPGTGTDPGTPVFELAQYTGSYCGTSLDNICSPCPSVDNDDGCSGSGGGCPGTQGCFTDFTCPGCFVQTNVASFERSGGGD